MSLWPFLACPFGRSLGDLLADVARHPVPQHPARGPTRRPTGLHRLELELPRRPLARTHSLGPGYAVGAVTPLADGGTRYTTVAAFLNPLPKGSHTVTYRALFDGAALAEFPDFFPGGIWQFESTFQVVVK
jgi:hypothetical protein